MKITIGTDPEFLLVNKWNDVERADHYSFFGGTGRNVKIGRDGAGRPVEIRPNPAKITNIEPLLIEIEVLLKQISIFCNENKFRLFGGATFDRKHPIGGHIHFGHPDLVYNGSNRHNNNMLKLIDLLDIYFTPITNFFIPRSNISSRSSSGYGKPGQFETKTYGFEYRTPYSFLLSPFLTRAFFSLAALIANNYKKVKVDHLLVSRVKDYYNNGLPDSQLINLYKSAKPKILKMMSYNSPNPQNNAHIISLFSLIEQKKKCACLNVLQNYKLLTFGKEGEIQFSGDDYMRDLWSILRDQLSLKVPEFLYVYGVKKRNTTTYGKKVWISEGLPLPTNVPADIKVGYKTFGVGTCHQNSIGLSYELRKDMYYKGNGRSFLVNYINEIQKK